MRQGRLSRFAGRRCLQRREAVSLREPNFGSPEKRNAARGLTSTATVLQIRGIAPINK
jgi:hypothetical protein